jgi:hypothetical protein
VLLNKHFETLKTPAIVALQNQEVYVNHFDPKQEVRGYKKANNQIAVIQPIQTTMSLSTIKSLPGIMEILTAGNAFINIHEWALLEISLTFNQLVFSLLGISIRDTEDSQTK